MLGQVGVASTPTLPVVDLAEAVRFYERAGFGVRIYKEDDDDPGGGFAFVDFDGQSVFDLDVIDIDPRRNGASCYLIVPEVDGWHARMTDAGLPVITGWQHAVGDARVHPDRPVWQQRSDRTRGQLARGSARRAQISVLASARRQSGDHVPAGGLGQCQSDDPRRFTR
jgi:catechol 2,3-dioxygenase-like lactoylglutathione lyase family enzyme